MGNTESRSTRRLRHSSSSLSTDGPPCPPYIDPVTQKASDVNHSDLKGWVTRKSKWLGEWRPRYCRLKGSYLFFSKGDQMGPHDRVDLSDSKLSLEGDCIVLKSQDTQDKFRVTHQSPNLDDWSSAIHKSMDQCLSQRTYEAKYLPMLTQGQMFTKHHHDPVGRFNLKSKDNSRLVKVSEDGQRITWHKAGRIDVVCDSIDLNSVVAVNPGYTTLVFKQTGDKGAEAHCFSIIAAERSLDLEASEASTARKWVDGLRALLKYSHVMSPEELRRHDMIKDMRIKEEERRKAIALRKHENDRAKLKAARERATKMTGVR